MGTNYYVDVVGEFNSSTGPHVLEVQDQVHVGKLSSGWQFHFQGYDALCGTAVRSAKAWRELMKRDNLTVIDEYHQTFSQDEFWGMVNERRTGFRNHFDWLYSQKVRLDYTEDWKDPEGFSFTSHDFW